VAVSCSIHNRLPHLNIFVLLEFGYHSLGRSWPLAQSDADLEHQIFEGRKNHGVWLIEGKEKIAKLGYSPSFNDCGGMPGELSQHFEHLEDSELV